MTGLHADIINRAKLYLNRVSGFDFVGGSNFWISHKKEKSPLTQGLNYRSACNIIIAQGFWNQTVTVTNLSQTFAALSQFHHGYQTNN